VRSGHPHGVRPARPTQPTNRDTPQMKIEIVTMTPEWALQILTQNTCNRRLIENIVAKYSREIEEGRWRLTQQGIAISTDNVLLDGQHRLTAIAKTGIPMQLVMATGCDPDIFSVIDTGRARRASDIMSIVGAPNSTTQAAGLKLYALYLSRPGENWHNKIYPSNSYLTGFYKEVKTKADYASELATSAYAKFRCISKSATMAFILIALDAGIKKEVIEGFCQRLACGAGLEADSPVLRYRSALMNGLISTRAAKLSSGGQQHLACLIKTFNYEMDGVTMKLFKVPPAFPMPPINLAPATK